MRTFILFCIGWVFLAVKCDTNWHERKNTFVKLKGKFDKSYKVVKLGDTLKFFVEIPDSLEVFYKMEGRTQVVSVNSVENCGASIRVDRVDTINKRTDYPDDYFTNPSVFLGFDNKLHKRNSGYINFPNSKPFTVFFSIIPQKKGIFYVSTNSVRMSNIKINRTIEGVTGLIIDMPEKNLDFLLPHIPEYVNSTDKIDDLYAFRVE